MIFEPLAPWWAIFLLFAPLIVVLLILIYKKAKTSDRSKWFIRFALVLLLLVVFLNPKIPGGRSNVAISDVDVYFVIDTTTSINAEDYDGNKQRIEGIKQDIKDIVENTLGARFSIVTFNIDTFRELPLTTDVNAVISYITALVPEYTVYSKGSTISLPVDFLANQFAADKENSPHRSIAMYYMGDGEQTSDQEIESFSELSKYLSGGAALGYGTEAGGRMLKSHLLTNSNLEEVYTEDYIKDYTQDFSGQYALSKIDEDNLKEIASDLGVEYFHRTQPGDISNFTIKTEDLRTTNKNAKVYNELYWLPASIIGIVLLFETTNLRRKLLEAKKLRRVSNER